MKYIAALMVVAMATIASGESVQMMELTPALSSSSDCEVALWCQDYATAARCGAVAYCRKWIWMDTMVSEPAITCDQCKKVAAQILNANVTDIDFICGFLKIPDLVKKCEQAMEEEFDKLGLTPLKVCQAVDFCPKSDLTQESGTEPKEDFCAVCKFAMKEVLGNLDEVKALLDDACKATGGMEDECDVLVDALVAEMKNLNQTYICKDLLHLCSNVSRQLLGADGCTDGPDYWCQTKDTARECRAFEYCTKKYWF